MKKMTELVNLNLIERNIYNSSHNLLFVESHFAGNSFCN